MILLARTEIQQLKSGGFFACSYCHQSGIAECEVSEGKNSHFVYYPPEQKSYPRTHEKFLFNAKLAENLNMPVRDLNWFIVIEWGN